MPKFSRDLFDFPGIQNVLAVLDPGDSPRGPRRFPNREGWGVENLRHSGESNSEWLRSIIDRVASSRMDRVSGFNDALGDCEISEGLAVFAILDWEGSLIRHCSVQIIVTEGRPLSDLIANPDLESWYYRLDCSSEERGIYFDHPSPHIHCAAKDAPRFPWRPRSDEFFLLSFLEFVIVNHRPATWKNWLSEIALNMDEWWQLDDEILPDVFLERYGQGEPLELLPQPSQRFELLQRVARMERQSLAPQGPLRLGLYPSSLSYWSP